MCGFAGIFTSKIIKKNKLKDMTRGMSQLLKHRGPDSNGVISKKNYSVGFQRLSILDTSKKGDQPFLDKDKNYILAFNGEIYNFIELKEKYLKDIKFKSNSDTEVLFYLLIKFGIKALSKIRGMYAFAFFDNKKKKLILARDHYGMKPLYFFFKEKKLFFSSEIKAFKHNIKFTLNEKKLFENCVWGNIAGEETIFKKINEVKPGHYYEINKNLSIKKKKYFNLEKTFSNKTTNFESVKNEINKSLNLHLRSDVKLGVLLSGGLDSSLVTALTNHNSNKKIYTFSASIVKSKFDESKNQNLIKKIFKTKNEKINFSERNLIENLKRCIYFYEYPLHHPNIVAIYELCKLANKKKVKVLLSGDGADELFGGYRWSFNFKKNKIFSNSIINQDIINRAYNIKKINFKERKRIINTKIEKYSRQRLYDQVVHLDKWLQRQDRMGMSNSVELRVPFCDINLAKLVNGFKQTSKNYKKNKFILKHISRNLLPKRLIDQKKRGFTIPLEDWFRKKLLKKFFIKIINSKSFKSRKIFNHKFINDTFIDHINNKSNHGKILWQVINLELWFRIFID